MQTRPLLLLDIDGPLNPYRAKKNPPGYELHETLPSSPGPLTPGKAAVRRRRSWKTSYVAEWVGERSFVWVDDEVNRRDRAYLQSRDGLGPHLLHRVEANRGLTEKDFELIREWAGANCS